MKAGVRLLLILPLLAGLSSLRADEDADIGALVRQLGSVRYMDRESASKQLKQMGEKALTALEQAQASEDGETRRRAELLVHAVRQRQETERLLAGQKVRFQFENVTVLSAIDRIAAETGLLFQIDGDRGTLGARTVTLDTGYVSLFEALDQFCRKAKLAERIVDTREMNYANPYTFQAGGRIEIMATRSYLEPAMTPPSRIILTDTKGAAYPPTFHAGGLCIRAIDSMLGSSRSGNGFVLEARNDPKLSFRGVAGLRIDKAVDDRGQELTAVDLQPGSFDSRRVPVRFISAANKSTKLAEVQGKLTALIQKTEELIAVESIKEASGKSFKGASGEVIEIGRTEAGNSHYSVYFRLRFSQSTLPVQVAMAQILRARRGFATRTSADGIAGNISLLDAAGKTMPSIQTQTNIVPMADGTVLDCWMMFQVQPGQTPARLVYSGQRVVAVDVPFVLRDVVLQ